MTILFLAAKMGVPADELRELREEILAAKQNIEGPGACVWTSEVLALWSAREAMRAMARALYVPVAVAYPVDGPKGSTGPQGPVSP